jgi:arabinose-5-phosphate isomerase
MLALGDALALTVMDLKAVEPEQYAAYHPGGALGRLLMKTSEIMRTGANCPTVPETATIADCHGAILRAPRRAGAACVVNDAGQLVGIITHGDFFRLFASPEPIAGKPVSDVMTKSPKSAGLNHRVTEALHLMRKYAIDELPVVDDDGKLMGMIDIQDLIARGFSSFDEP